MSSENKTLKIITIFAMLMLSFSCDYCQKSEETSKYDTLFQNIIDSKSETDSFRDELKFLMNKKEPFKMYYNEEKSQTTMKLICTMSGIESPKQEYENEVNKFYNDLNSDNIEMIDEEIENMDNFRNNPYLSIVTDEKEKVCISSKHCHIIKLRPFKASIFSARSLNDPNTPYCKSIIWRIFVIYQLNTMLKDLFENNLRGVNIDARDILLRSQFEFAFGSLNLNKQNAGNVSFANDCELKSQETVLEHIRRLFVTSCDNIDIVNAGILFYQLATNEKWDFLFNVNNKEDFLDSDLKYENLELSDNKWLYAKDLQKVISDMMISSKIYKYKKFHVSVNNAITDALTTIKRQYIDLKSNESKTEIEQKMYEEYNPIKFLNEFIAFMDGIKKDDEVTKTYLANTLSFFETFFMSGVYGFSTDEMNEFENHKELIKSKLAEFDLALNEAFFI